MTQGEKVGRGDGMTPNPYANSPDMKLAGFERAVELLIELRLEMMQRPAPPMRLNQEMRLLKETEDFLRMFDRLREEGRRP